jgi:hypothetical protein
MSFSMTVRSDECIFSFAIILFLHPSDYPA